MPHQTEQAPVTETYIDYFKPSTDGSVVPEHGDYGNEWRERKTVQVKDMRAGDFTLDKDGFQLIPYQAKMTKLEDFQNPDLVKEQYYPEVAEVIKQAAGAKYVHIMYHAVRSSSGEFSHADKYNGPIRECHVDITPAGLSINASRRGAEARLAMIKGRFKVINAWRPIRVVERDPLAVARLVPDDDLCVINRGGGVGHLVEERYVLKAPQEGKHEWYIVPQQTPEELLCFTQYSDKKGRGSADRVPHAAICLPGQEDKPARQSIEVRAIVVF